jgi:hypothetical protein
MPPLHRTPFEPLSRTLVLVTLATCVGQFAIADTLHLKNGGTVEGQVLEFGDTGYRVRTMVGVVTVPLASVERVEEGHSPFEDYDQQIAETPDTAEGWYSLAEWCAQHELAPQRRKHLKRVLELAPDHAEARKALAYVRVGELWVDGRRARSQPAELSPMEQAADEQAEQIRAVQGTWSRQIHAIQVNLLDSTLPRLVRDGRDRILEIRDPLAILPMAQILSVAGLDSREVLAEALGSFAEDEATMNLTVMALIDPDAQIRRRCVTELAKRQDPRVVQQIREALNSDSDFLIHNAARALGVLKDRGAIPALIGVLKVGRRKDVEVPYRRYFGQYEQTFGTATTGSFGGSTYSHTPAMGIGGGRTAAGVLIDPRWVKRDVTVYRTVVLEALKTITNQNFGFDDAAWRQWYKEESP